MLKVSELIEALKEVIETDGDMLVGVSTDTEGNEWSLLPNISYIFIDNCDGKEGLQGIESEGNFKVAILLGSYKK